MSRTASAAALEPRDPKFKTVDLAALRAIAQGAVDVELFTIPLYMTSLYSIAGSHEINDQYALYQGWIWPGAGPVAVPTTPNEKAFNILFSIFIEEMLHLQMAANMATAVGVSPSFTSTSLQTSDHGWKCYGEFNSVIPNIIDLRDTILEEPHQCELNVPVDIGPLDETRLKLFLAIEQPDADARAAIREEAKRKYFPTVPFDNWTAQQPLPLFGTIGHMYQCYYDYLHVTYTDGSTLWQAAFDPKAVQNDHFNKNAALKQYGFSLALDLSSTQTAFTEMCRMMDAITDQGEGSELVHMPDPKLLQAVMPEYRALKPNLEQIYVSYDNAGTKQPQSADANARCDNDAADHYERFTALNEMLPQITTWATNGKPGNWTAADFIAPNAPSGQWPNPHGLPSPEDLADAWNRIYNGDRAGNEALFSQACVGSIAGTTTVLEAYWQDPTVGFPGPAMGGTGNRLSTIWAAMGRKPNLSLGLEPMPKNTLGHSCQAIDYNIKAGGEVNACATVQTFHSCIGSNNCHAEGGCGFVNKVTGGGSCSGTGGGGSCSTAVSAGGGVGNGAGAGGTCGAPAPSGGGMLAMGSAAAGGTCGAAKTEPGGGQGGGAAGGSCGSNGCGTPAPSGGGSVGGVCGAPVIYSAPGDNKCKGFGGCAVPISASQLYPPPPNGKPEGGMEGYDYTPDSSGYNGYTSVKTKIFPYKGGDKVDAVAYEAFKLAMAARTPPVEVPDTMPAPSDLRLVFPPST